MLSKGSSAELMISFRPLVPGQVNIELHVVNADTGALLKGFLLCASSQAPTVSETYEVI